MIDMAPTDDWREDLHRRGYIGIFPHTAMVLIISRGPWRSRSGFSEETAAFLMSQTNFSEKWWSLAG